MCMYKYIDFQLCTHAHLALINAHVQCAKKIFFFFGSNLAKEYYMTFLSVCLNVTDQNS